MRLFYLYALIITIFNFSFASPTPNPAPLSTTDLIQVAGIGGLVKLYDSRKNKKNEAARQEELEKQRARVEAAEKGAKKASKKADALQRQLDEHGTVLRSHSDDIRRVVHAISGSDGRSGVTGDIRFIKSAVDDLHKFALRQ